MTTPVGDLYEQWQAATRTLVHDRASLLELQDHRYAFAAHVGQLLAGPVGEIGPVVGPALYGVISVGAGLLYVGQTVNAERRLRDLAIGESHHLANTVPPEVWDRVVVVQWPVIATSAAIPMKCTGVPFDAAVVGKSLEWMLQRDLDPVLNSRRRGTGGQWRPRDHASSTSRGAQAAPGLAPLYSSVLDVWKSLTERGVEGEVFATAVGRVVLPAVVVESGVASAIGL